MRKMRHIHNEGHQTRLFDTSFYLEFMEDWTMNSLKSGVFNVVKNLDISVGKLFFLFVVRL